MKEHKLGNERHVIHKVKTAVNVKIKGMIIKMRIDTCSDVNIIDEAAFKQINHVVKLKYTNVKLYGYNSSKPINIIGKFTETIETRKKLFVTDFYDVKGKCGSLINADTAEA